MAKRKRIAHKGYVARDEHFQQGNISLIIDTYDDLFSDFDPRPFGERAISDDFLVECRRAVRGKTTEKGMELNILIPRCTRQIAIEGTIKKRLEAHFKKHYQEKLKEHKSTRRKGVALFLLGSVLMYTTTILYTKVGAIYRFLQTLCEPAGWFTVWVGLDMFFFYAREPEADLIFYKSMLDMEIKFKGY